MDQGKAILAKMRVTFPISSAQAMLDICLTLGFIQRTQMISRRHPLPQLIETRAAECGPELRLPEQKALQRHCPIEDDVRQHAQLFERFKRQVLCLVDD